MKFLLSLLSVILVSCSCSHLQTTDLYRETEQSVYRLETSNSSCTAWLGAPGLVVTAAHCVEEKEGLILHTGKFDLIDPPILLVDIAQDIAILFAPAISDKPIKLSSNIPEVGEDLTSIGYPASFVLMDGEFRKTFGTGKFRSFAKLKTWFGSVQRYLATDIVFPGDSGGPVLNDKGEIIGLSSAIAPKFREFVFPDGQISQVTRHISIIVPNFLIEIDLEKAKRLISERKML